MQSAVSPPQAMGRGRGEVVFVFNKKRNCMPERPIPEEFSRPNENIETQELSPEFLEMVMAKVQDINKKGIGFHTIKTFNWDDVRDILQNGLLGRTKGANKKNPDSWAKAVRKNKSAEVYFNITGRFKIIMPKQDAAGNTLLDEQGKEVEEALPAVIENSQWGAKESVTFLFDLNTFKENVQPQGDKDENRKKLPVHSFTPNLGVPIRGVDEGNKPVVDSQGGFELKARVAPRFFRGIVIGLNKSYYNLLSPAEIRAKVDEIIKNMKDIYKDKQDLMLPVYDIQGNLLWPKEMSYEEVKEFLGSDNKK
jgi:hypothetical protein